MLIRGAEGLATFLIQVAGVKPDLEHPTPGEWYEHKGKRYFCVGPNENGAMLFRQDDPKHRQTHLYAPSSEFTHLPNCIGFNWVDKPLKTVVFVYGPAGYGKSSWLKMMNLEECSIDESEFATPEQIVESATKMDFDKVYVVVGLTYGQEELAFEKAGWQLDSINIEADVIQEKLQEYWSSKKADEPCLWLIKHEAMNSAETRYGTEGDVRADYKMTEGYALTRMS